MSQEKPLVFRVGKKVVLRPMRKSTDLEPCLRWINDPEVSRFLKAFVPTTEAMETEWFDQIGKSKNDFTFAVEILPDHVFIGVMSLHRVNWKDGTATTGAIIGEKEYWGRGYGKEAKMLLLDFAFNTLNLRKICSSVKAFNGRSLNYNKRCGYQEEGRRAKQFFVDGAYHDEIFLAIFREDWLPLWAEYQKTGEVQ